MKIVLLCRNLHTAGGRVVGLNFLRCFREVANGHRVLVIAPPDVGYEDIELPEGSELFLYKGGQNTFHQWKFDTIKLPLNVKKFAPDIVFAMGNVGLLFPPCSQAILFHKPQLIYPAKHYAKEVWKSKMKNRLIKNRLKRCLKNTQIVFCQTPVARDRFSHEFSYPIEQIRIMPNAVSEFVKIARDRTAVPEVFRQKGYFNLFNLTKFYAHKNLEILIDVFKRHRKPLRDVRCIITVAPDQHPNAPKFLEDIKRYNLQEHIVNVGPLRQEELAGYFYNADALLFPTLLESFSGTYMEAMHFGLPILTSDLDFARYVCSDAAFYFDPWKPEHIVNNILRLKGDKNLKTELVRKGEKRIHQFFKSWEAITTEVINELELLVHHRL